MRESWLLWSLRKAGLPVRRKDAGLKAWHKDPGLPRLRWGRAGELDLQNCKLKTALRCLILSRLPWRWVYWSGERGNPVLLLW